MTLNTSNGNLNCLNGNKITLDSLNGYQKGVVLNDCMAYFTGGTYHKNSDEPCGVIKIEEKEI